MELVKSRIKTFHGRESGFGRRNRYAAHYAKEKLILGLKVLLKHRNTGGVLGAYSEGASRFFAPQDKDQPLTWGRFMANYYLMDRYSSDATQIYHAVGTIPDDYSLQEYIRGALAWVLKAKNDNMVSGEVPLITQPELMVKGYYGLAPWKAMNYALYQYNLVGAQVKEPHNCKAHYVNNSTGCPSSAEQPINSNAKPRHKAQ